MIDQIVDSLMLKYVLLFVSPGIILPDIFDGFSSY